jgi:hypothetical protein
VLVVLFRRAGVAFEAEIPLAWEDAWPLKRLRSRLLEGLPDGRHGVLDELAPGHPVLNVGYVEIGVEEDD